MWVPGSRLTYRLLQKTAILHIFFIILYTDSRHTHTHPWVTTTATNNDNNNKTTNKVKQKCDYYYTNSGHI